MFYGAYGLDAGDVSDASSQARRASTNVRLLQTRVERLELVCEAMWELLKGKHGYSDEELMGWMAELDLADGKADGKRERKGPVACPSCNRSNSRRHEYCMYCGTHLKTGPFG